MNVPAISGEQWTIRHGADEVVVVEVGGGLRSWLRGDVHVLAGYGAGELCLAGRGQTLLPWPNRIRDGRYVVDGVTKQLPLSEPKLGNASHGLVRFANWHLIERGDSSLTVGLRLHPQPGWDGTLDLTTTYALSEAGLSVTTTATNVGAVAVPFGHGAHPYISIGDADPATVVLRVPAGQRMRVDERMLPVDLVPVANTEFDFRTPRPVGQVALDTAFTDLTRDDESRWHVTLSGLPGRGAVALWGDKAYGWTQVFTGKAAAEGEHGIAVEPMTMPADAFNSGADLIMLASGDRWSGTWGITLGAGSSAAGSGGAGSAGADPVSHR